MIQIKPNLYIVGFQKCGSSSFAELLNQHWEVALSNPKETFVLSDFTSSNYRESDNIHNKEFSWNKYYSLKGTEKYMVEASVNNFHQKTALEYISNIEGSKVIFILRDPLDRLWSSYEYYFKSKPENLENNSFEHFLSIQNKSTNKNDAVNYGVQFGKYDHYIEMWKSELGNSRIFVTSLKLLKSSTQDEMNKVCKFLDIESFSFSPLPVRNRTQHIKWPKLTNFLYRNFAGSILANNKLAFLFHKINSSRRKTTKNKLLFQFKKYYRVEYDKYSEFF